MSTPSLLGSAWHWCPACGRKRYSEVHADGSHTCWTCRSSSQDPMITKGFLMSTRTRTLTQQQLLAEARDRFGKDPLDWAFLCPACGDVATGRDFRAALAEHPRNARGEQVTVSGLLGQECIGRTDKARGCDWAASGLIAGPWTVELPHGRVRRSFPLAEAPAGEQSARDEGGAQ